MENSQTERLLKIAETDPELAHKIADFMKESDKISTKSATEVKIVKDEEDKLVITDEQKRWAMLFLFCIIFSILSFIICFISMANANFDDMAKSGWPPAGFFAPFVMIPISTAIGYLCAYKTGMPIIKQYLSKHFTFQ